jgi:hypothetical protein
LIFACSIYLSQREKDEGIKLPSSDEWKEAKNDTFLNIKRSGKRIRMKKVTLGKCLGKEREKVAG